MRTPKPWYWAARDGWYIRRGNQNVLLAKGKANKRDAERAFHALMAREPGAPAAQASPPSLTVEELAGLFVLDCRRRGLSDLTVRDHTRYLALFGKAHGEDPAESIRVHHLTAFLARRAWGPTTRFNFLTSLKRAWSWAHKQGLIPRDELKAAEKPTPRARGTNLTDADLPAVLEKVAPEFRDLLVVLRETGCRPSEAYAVEARDVDLAQGVWVRPGKTTGKTGKPRVVYLNDKALEVVGRLCAANPQGPIFRNSRGEPWNRNSVTQRFEHLRAHLPPHLAEVSASSLRKVFVTEALVRGVEIATVSELVGHASTKMVAEHYSQLHRRTQFLRAAAGSVSSGSGPSRPASGPGPRGADPGAPGGQPGPGQGPGG